MSGLSWIQELSAVSIPFPENPHALPLRYGTAGFRLRVCRTLSYISFTVGLLASLRSKFLNSQTVGVMITASHNPKCDNGVKIIEPSGEMLTPDWEVLAEKLANCLNVEQLSLALREICVELGLDSKNETGVVYVGRDSRDSGEELLSVMTTAIRVVPGVRFVDYGLVTTPQLHYLVYTANRMGEQDDPPLETYYSNMKTYSDEMMPTGQVEVVWVDCACAVGAKALEEIQIPWLKGFNSYVDHPEWLNDGCGTDFIVNHREFPRGFREIPGSPAWIASFDGDADRLVLVYGKEDELCLLDGDKISSLFARYFSSMLCSLGIENDLSVGIVQTAYANGGSTAYLKSVLPDGGESSLRIAKTGVKHLHHIAKSFDIGVYFEANGHGTVLFSDQARTLLTDGDLETTHHESQEKLDDLAHLRSFVNLINPAVGDALSDLLAILGVLTKLKMTIFEWDGIYTNLPSVLRKAGVPDRSVIRCNDSETRVLQPPELQEAIDRSVIATGDASARSFVRPSGTEDVVRIYAEASSLETAQKLADEVAGHVTTILV